MNPFPSEPLLTTAEYSWKTITGQYNPQLTPAQDQLPSGCPCLKPLSGAPLSLGTFPWSPGLADLTLGPLLWPQLFLFCPHLAHCWSGTLAYFPVPKWATFAPTPGPLDTLLLLPFLPPLLRFGFIWEVLPDSHR